MPKKLLRCSSALSAISCIACGALLCSCTSFIWNQVQETVSVEMIANAALKNSAEDCDEILRKPIQSQVVWRAYPNCRSELALGSGVTLLITQEFQTIGAMDSNRQNIFIVEIQNAMPKTRIQLPDPRVNVFVHNCRHFWVDSSGCLFGESARGYLEIEETLFQGARLKLEIFATVTGELAGENEEWVRGKSGEVSVQGVFPLKSSGLISRQNVH